MKKIFYGFLTLVMFLFTACTTSEPVEETVQVQNYSVTTETVTENVKDESGKEVFTVEFTYPIVTSQKENTAVKELNEKFKKEALDFVAKTRSGDLAENAKDNAKIAKQKNIEFYPHSSTIKYVIEYSNDNIVSFLKATEEYVGGTDHIYKSEGETYNLDNCKKLELSEVFEATNIGLNEILEKGFNEEAKNNPNLYTGKTSFTSNDFSDNIKDLKWYLGGDGIVFFFNPDTIIPENKDILQFTYPYTGNKTMFKVPIN